MSTQPIRVLVSENDARFARFVSDLVGRIAQVAVTVVKPASNRARDFLDCADAEEWDLAFVVPSNVAYDSGDRSPEGVRRDAAALIGKLVEDFHRPILVVSNWPEQLTTQLREAGALRVSALPASGEDLEEAVRQALAEMAANPALPRPERLRLRAAEGWIALGRLADADEELEKISEVNRARPAVLKARWRVYAKAENWAACLEVATLLTEKIPGLRSGWLQRAESLHKLGRTGEAKEVLLEGSEQFAPDATISYHLARYCCRLGQLGEAKEWLDLAFEIGADRGDPGELKRKAFEDSDLRAIRKKP